MTAYQRISPDELLARIIARLDIVKGPDAKGNYTAWCIFHPDGKGSGTSHTPNLCVSLKGFHCFRCNAHGGLLSLAQELGLFEDGRSVQSGERIYDYADENGNVVFQVVRCFPKRFYQRRPDGAGGWINNLKGVDSIPYRLPDLLHAAPDATVFVVEGEKDVDRLRGIGIVATCNAGGAGKWKPDFGKYLKDRPVVILPDDDEPGRRHAEKVAAALTMVAESVKIILLPGLPEKGDVSDWLDAGHSIDELLHIVADTPVWVPVEASLHVSKQRTSRTSEYLAIAKDAIKDLFRDQFGEPYAVINTANGQEITPVQHSRFAYWLSGIYHKVDGSLVSKEIIKRVQEHLVGVALFEARECHLWARHARDQQTGDLWIDMDGHHAIQVTSAGWQVVEHPPILFRPSPGLLSPFPNPVRGGDPWQLFKFISVGDWNQQVLLLCYLVSIYFPNIAIPVLVIFGEAGVSKTTTLKMIRTFIDPSTAEVQTGLTEMRDFEVQAQMRRVICLDNITSLPAEHSNAICSAVTGDSQVRRVLNTNKEFTVFSYQNVIMIGGLNIVPEKGDLLDRCIMVELSPITPERRLAESSLKRAFEDAAPSILGGILDVLVQVQASGPATDLTALPRMADFAQYGAAVADVLGIGRKTFLEAYAENVNIQHKETVQASPLAQCIIELMNTYDQWEGTATTLYTAVSQIADVLRLTRSPEWPKASNSLPKRLNEILSALRAHGIIVSRPKRTSDARTIVLIKEATKSVTAVTTVTGRFEKQASGDNS